MLKYESILLYVENHCSSDGNSIDSFILPIQGVYTKGYLSTRFFKGTMSSMQICNIMRTDQKYFPKSQTVKIPIADGGRLG